MRYTEIINAISIGWFAAVHSCPFYAFNILMVNVRIDRRSILAMGDDDIEHEFEHIYIPTLI